MGPFKFIPLFFDRISAIDEDNTENIYYTPIYVLVPNDFLIDLKNPPNEIPMLLWANYYVHEHIWPVVLVNVPIIYEK